MKDGRLNTKTHSSSANEVTPANGPPRDVSTDYVQALRAARNSERSGATMKECDCGVSSENIGHMLVCPLLAHSGSLDDLLQFNETVKQCVKQWKAAV